MTTSQGDEIPNAKVEDKLQKEKLRTVGSWALGFTRKQNRRAGLRQGTWVMGQFQFSRM